MAETITLEAQPRTTQGKQVKQLRAEGLIPAVIYGPEAKESIQIQIPLDDLKASLRQAGGTNLIEIVMGKDKHNVLVRDVQRGVLLNELLHVDFYAVSLDTRITTEVPIVTVGVAEIVKSGLAMLITRSNTIEIECLPTAIPNELHIDISKLAEIGDYLTVADIPVPEGVSILADPEEILVRTDYAASLEPEVEEEVDEFAEEVDAAGVEVISRAKEEEDFEE
jgi:large subunit ribosomal protein L25